MDGMTMMVRSVLGALGVQIDPAEITAAVEQAKILIPKIAENYVEVNTRLDRIEKLLMDRATPSITPTSNCPVTSNLPETGVITPTITLSTSESRT